MRRGILFLFSLIGILFLLLTSQNNYLEIRGFVSDVRNLGEVKVINLQGFEEEIVLFTSEIVILNKGDEIKIVGTKNKYRGKEQIVADKIWKVG